MTPQDYRPEGPLQRTLHRADLAVWSLGGVFGFLANLCLLVMLLLTATTIVLRPFNLSFYWIWPWTMVFFIWLSFFGFFAMYVRLKDVRVDFLAARFGPLGMAATRVVADLATLVVVGIILWQLPAVLATSRGVYDGAILPDGIELPRQALSIPLFVSAFLILLAALLDVAKLFAGMPENVAETHPES